jgi:hypothetical protein
MTEQEKQIIREQAISDTIEAIKEHTRIVGTTGFDDLDEIAALLKSGKLLIKRKQENKNG